MGIKRESDYFVCVLVTYNPGDALFGNGRREKRGDTGTIGICGSNDLRTNSGDDSMGLCEWFMMLVFMVAEVAMLLVIVCRDIFDGIVYIGINPLLKWLNNEMDTVKFFSMCLIYVRFGQFQRSFWMFSVILGHFESIWSILRHVGQFQSKFLFQVNKYSHIKVNTKW